MDIKTTAATHTYVTIGDRDSFASMDSGRMTLEWRDAPRDECLIVRFTGHAWREFHDSMRIILNGGWDHPYSRLHFDGSCEYVEQQWKETRQKCERQREQLRNLDRCVKKLREQLAEARDEKNKAWAVVKKERQYKEAMREELDKTKSRIDTLERELESEQANLFRAFRHYRC